MIVASDPQTVVRFGVFEADFRAHELRRSGAKVKIQDLPFRALSLLLERPNEVITREEFRQVLWPQDVFVDFESGISSAIKRLRDALGDAADNPIFIETMERRGYRWIAPTTTITPTAMEAVSAATATGTTAADSSPNAVANEADVNFSTTAPQPPTVVQERARFSPRLLLYVLPALVLVLAIWSFRSGSGLASSGLHSLHPANQQAKDLYLQGRYYWSRRTPDDLNKAVDYFTQSIVHDPGYADAYVGLADSYNLLREYTAMPASEAYPRALAAAAKAVELDSKSSQAHASLAFASFWGFWDAATADREFRRAIALDPNNAIAHHWDAMTLAEIGRFPQALEEIDRAQALDPSSRSILADKAVILNLMGRQKEATDLLQQMEKADPGFMSPHRYLKSFYLQNGDYRGYLAEQRAEAVLTNDASALQLADAAEKGFVASGAPGMFESLRREQKSLFDQGRLDPYALAQTSALSGDKAGALKYLQVAYNQHSQNMPGIVDDFSFDSVRSDPAFRRLQAEMKLPYTQPAR
jgi:DNA-binding winged helix-turn-helix (wHTH) protein/tetratricopeptide (TPR) repeat protein